MSFQMSELIKEDALESQITRLRGCVINLVNRLFRGLEDGLRPYDFNVTEYWVFASCFTHEPITISGLGEFAPLASGRASRMVSRFEDRGLVRKVRLREDRRVVWVEMTDEGKALAAELLSVARAHYVNVMGGVTEEELTRLIDFVEKMASNAESVKAG